MRIPEDPLVDGPAILRRAVHHPKIRASETSEWMFRDVPTECDHHSLALAAEGWERNRWRRRRRTRRQPRERDSWRRGGSGGHAMGLVPHNPGSSSGDHVANIEIAPSNALRDTSFPIMSCRRRGGVGKASARYRCLARQGAFGDGGETGLLHAPRVLPVGIAAVAHTDVDGARCDRWR